MFLDFLNKKGLKEKIMITLIYNFVGLAGCGIGVQDHIIKNEQNDFDYVNEAEAYYKSNIMEQNETMSLFHYELIDKNQDVILEKEVRARDISFEMVSSTLMKVSVIYGEGIESVWCSYFNIETGDLSEEYSGILYEDEKLVAYYSKDKIIVNDIFDWQNFYSEYDLTEKNVDIANAEISIKKSETGDYLLADIEDCVKDYSFNAIIDLTEESFVSKIYERNQWFSIYSGSHEEDYFGYYYDLYEKDGTIFRHEYTGNVWPQITMKEDNVIEVSLQLGTGISTKQNYYYDAINKRQSQIYSYPLCERDGIIAYYEKNKIVVSEIFDSNATYAVIDMRGKAEDSVEPILDAAFTDDRSAIEVHYVSVNIGKIKDEIFAFK